MKFRKELEALIERTSGDDKELLKAILSDYERTYNELVKTKMILDDERNGRQRSF